MSSATIKESLEWLDKIQEQAIAGDPDVVRVIQLTMPLLQATYLGGIAYQLAVLNERNERLDKEAKDRESNPAMQRPTSIGASEQSVVDRVAEESTVGRVNISPGTELHGIFHQLWSRAVGTPDYNKQQWIQFEKLINKL